MKPKKEISIIRSKPIFLIPFMDNKCECEVDTLASCHEEDFFSPHMTNIKMSEGEETGRKITIHSTRNAKGKPLFKGNAITTTKYNVLSFLPKNLFEQFSRIANFYFLVSACIMYFPWSPLNSATALVPLVIVVAISAVREAIEDFMRYLSDKHVNNETTQRLENRIFVEAKWRDILVGDVLLIQKDQSIPADVVLLNTSEKDGIAYIDTCNLDGETNLKFKQSFSQASLVVDGATAAGFNGDITCDEPNNLLYTFNGYLDHNGAVIPIDNKQVLLRGCVLRNTKWIIGVVVYTGLESKLMMNSSAARTKRSSLEMGLNMKLITIFCFMIVISIIGGGVGLYKEMHSVNNGDSWYMFQKSTHRSPASAFFILLCSYLLLMNAMIPISLYVTLEVVRVFQARFIAWDKQMYFLPEKTAANARTSNLSEDLGMIEYVFSDKTGTLTRNVMEFMKCSIAGRKYGSGTTEVAYAAAKRQGKSIPPPMTEGKAFRDKTFTDMLQNKPPREVEMFLWMLSVCNAVIPEEDPKKEYGIAFQASSPDEGALVKAAADFGYILHGKGHDTVTVSRNGTDVQIPILANIEFSSERKRSSIVTRDPDTNEIILYTKGADDTILSRLSKDSQYKDVTYQHLKEFAADGLRTLCAAYKIIDEDFFNDWFKRYNQALSSMENRDEKVDEVANEIENELFLLGATAIEDKLQAGVPSTIEALLQAGINIWIITGDKRETAINIGFACSLLASDMNLIVIDYTDEEEVISAINRGLQQNGKLALVISGDSLYFALDDKNKEIFLALSQRCQSVVCCRVSPLQKANIVELVRTKTGKITLAIGDGANDVGMILKADIGVGISGQEGRQAVLASDYSFAQFRFLKRLLLYHGRLNFLRNVELINYSFYKNMLSNLTQYIYGIFCNFSAMTLIDGMMLGIYNVVFTSIPPIIYASMERDISEKNHMLIPDLYKWDGKRQEILSTWRFWKELLLGVVHACVCFFVPYFGMYPYSDQFGNSVGYAGLGVCVYGCIIIVANIRIAMKITYWTALAHVFVWGSILIYPLIVIIMDYLDISSGLFGLSLPSLTASSFWISVIGAAILSYLPVIGLTAVMNSEDSLQNKVMMIERTDVKRKFKTKEEELETLDSTHPPVSTLEILEYPDKSNETGYNFDQPVTRLNSQVQNRARTQRPMISRRTISTFSLSNL